MAADVIPLGARRRGAWRIAVGRVLRDWRTEQGLRLADVAGRAGVSVQYLSEVERGRKEPSSEVLGAVTEALGSSLAELALGVADGLRDSSAPDRDRTPGTVTSSAPDRTPGAVVSLAPDRGRAPGSVTSLAGRRQVPGRGAAPGSVTLLAA